MGLAQRDDQLHTYAEYLTWPDEVRYELIDGVAYLMAPPAPTLDHQDFAVEVLSPSTASHDQVRKRRIYERAGVREYWLVHPTDRIITIYRLENGEFGKPDVGELSGETPVGVLPGIAICWDGLVSRLPRPDW